MGSTMAEVPIRILRLNTRKSLADMLNPVKVIRSDENLCRDWRGFAHLCGIHLMNCSKHKNPTEEVFLKWQESDEATIARLYELLERLDRFDVIADSEDMINEDVQLYLRGSERISVNQVALTSNEQQVLTVDDIYRRDGGLEPQMYDAIVLYDDSEWDAVEILITELERYNFKLCLKDRDIIPGVNFEHETFMTLIKERCNRVLILLSPNFLKCPFNNFLQLYAQALSIEERRRKVIPCLYNFASRRDVPNEFRFYTMLSYNDLNKWPDNFWNRLRTSISSESTTVSNIAPSSVKIRELTSSEYTEQITQEIKCVPHNDKSLQELSSKKLAGNSENSLIGLDCGKSCDSLKHCIEDNYLNESEKKRTFCRIRKLFRTLLSSKHSSKQTKKGLGSKCAVMAE